MKAKTDPRHNSRKLALSSIFCWLFNDTETEACALLSKEHLDSEEIDQFLTDYIVGSVKEHLDDIDSIIEKAAPEWPIEKISKVDLVILRIAIAEIVFGNKTPVKVGIDEAVELAKEFGNDTSHKFVNGVLGTVVEDLGKSRGKNKSEVEIK
ncbi:transcription antitermination factor NusB [candidate division WWE3 bacterium]|uniref:Transcription antitermination protein NusB n=1 Tax=candidate division WWE3 bacterium TaxID=2053526 RepID=A0A7X9HHG3_UNCKA|nr:transcription antitermination factor NusB [candidate division WWE3 bacterium]